VEGHLAGKSSEYRGLSAAKYIERAGKASKELGDVVRHIFYDSSMPAETHYRTCDGLINLQRSKDPILFRTACETALTEVYNPIPNFFISARIPQRTEGHKFLSFEDAQLVTQTNSVQFNRQFENRLFDRDTLLLCHYDVNFLYIVSLYGRANKSKQATWREYVRREFRRKIQETFNRLYTFRIIQPRAGMDCHQYLKEHFSLLNGKLYRSRANKNYLVLALMKGEEQSQKLWQQLNVKPTAIAQEMEENTALLDKLQSHFHVSNPFALEDELHVEKLSEVGTLEPLSHESAKQGVLMVMMENFETKRGKFLPSGRLAVGIKYTRDGIEIANGLPSVGYILFHTRKDQGQHLFHATSALLVKDTEKLPADIYKNIQTTDMYVVVEIDHTNELDSSSIHSGKKAFTPNTRYDAQFALISELR
ncbi:MAG: hypothetical protein ACI4C3_03230, partial [Bacteroides sp.]